MSAQSDAMENRFLQGSVSKLFFKTATPIVIIMMVNGLYNVVDAWYLGEFVGAEALTAVTLMFPVQMLVFALSAMVSAGMSSMLARRIGADDKAGAQSCFTVAHILAVAISGFVVLAFALGGEAFVLSIADGAEQVATIGYRYIIILIMATPLMFILSVHIDVLRAEGAMKVMTLVTLSATLLNIVFNYIFIVQMGMGVEGSAYGTVTAQALCMAAILLYYRRVVHRLSLSAVSKDVFRADAKEMLALGMPSTLNFVGVSLITIAAIYGLQLWPSHDYEATVGAYGIITRLTTFAFLPLMGITMAFQTVVGHNFGAGNKARTNQTLWIAIKTAFVYCLLMEILFIVTADKIGALFVEDATMISETGRLLPYMVIAFFSFGPSMVVAQFFQAIGDAKKAALLNLSRTYMFLLPLMFVLPPYLGEIGIWYARPIAELGVILLTLMVLGSAAKKTGMRYGLFYQSA